MSRTRSLLGTCSARRGRSLLRDCAVSTNGRAVAVAACVCAIGTASVAGFRCRHRVHFALCGTRGRIASEHSPMQPDERQLVEVGQGLELCGSHCSSPVTTPPPHLVGQSFPDEGHRRRRAPAGEAETTRWKQVPAIFTARFAFPDEDHRRRRVRSRAQVDSRTRRQLSRPGRGVCVRLRRHERVLR